jgi:hypothetical protein
MRGVEGLRRCLQGAAFMIMFKKMDGLIIGTRKGVCSPYFHFELPFC